MVVWTPDFQISSPEDLPDSVTISFRSRETGSAN
jgi:hypothetical protein